MSALPDNEVNALVDAVYNTVVEKLNLELNRVFSDVSKKLDVHAVEAQQKLRISIVEALGDIDRKVEGVRPPNTFNRLVNRMKKWNW